MKNDTTPENDTGGVIAQTNDTLVSITPNFINPHKTENLMKDIFGPYNEDDDNPTMQSLFTSHVHESPERAIGTKSPDIPLVCLDVYLLPVGGTNRLHTYVLRAKRPGADTLYPWKLTG